MWPDNEFVLFEHIYRVTNIIVLKIAEKIVSFMFLDIVFMCLIQVIQPSELTFTQM